MGWESLLTTTLASTKENGSTTREMELGTKDSVTATLIKVSTKMAKLMVKAGTTGPLENSTKASGKKDSRTAMEFGKASKMTLLLVNGGIINPMGLESMYGEVATGTKANGNTA